MTKAEFLDKYVDPYSQTMKWGWSANGFIVWRKSTGLNAELLHLKVFKPGNGAGTTLLKHMLIELKDDPPYATVFGFTRTVNTSAQEFYRAMGFDLSPVRGVYDDGDAVVFSARYDDLCKKHGIE